MRLSEFDFDLPERLIAIRPARPRSSSRLLVATKRDCIDAHAIDLPDHLRPGDRLVLNDTRVIPARLTGTRRRAGTNGETRAKVEATLLEPCADGTWEALLKPLKRVREGEVIEFSNDLSAAVVGRGETTACLGFNLEGQDFDAALAEAGAMPLPPYIESRRPADELDRQDYQAIWARVSGAVAAPTASLHFDEALLARLNRAGMDRSFVTLHVGAGTFLPVKTDDISDHRMHAERGVISEAAAAEIMKTVESGGRVIPVGTTALRLLEAAADANGTIRPWQGSTEIFIAPGYRFRISDALITNFHLPRSTLIMLVSAFMGIDRIREVYAHAIAQEYRFFSYGDASLLLPAE
ncbi:MAG: tRNA preQ1(34) S-adenosylmethionine ribosyltransferase-isomerase QueA [Boseongicola sp. SB0670_bin_30]|nr:tRNA preQ1(34) S-adenosylmethionine ribosyltransferase-isomerase QueA [Boseongicola sp. SB0670_bin_30]